MSLALSVEISFVNKYTSYDTMLLDTGSQVTMMQGYSTYLEIFNDRKGLIDGLGENLTPRTWAMVSLQLMTDHPLKLNALEVLIWETFLEWMYNRTYWKKTLRNP